MKNIFKIFVMGTALVFLITACEKVVTNVDLPDYQSKLVVHCFLSPEDSKIVVQVGESIPIFATTPLFPEYKISNANVRIIGPGVDVLIPYDDESQAYIIPSSSVQVNPGTSYNLIVSVPDGRSVSASTTVPYHVNTSLIITDVTASQEYFDEYSIGFRFQDRYGTGDFYRIAAYWGLIDSLYGGGYYELYPEKGESLVSDLNKDGDIFTYRVSIFGQTNDELSFYLLTTNEEYYRYHKTINAYSGDDPFSEPVIIYSNIDGGLGVFAAFRSFEIDTVLFSKP